MERDCGIRGWQWENKRMKNERCMEFWWDKGARQAYKEDSLNKRSAAWLQKGEKYVRRLITGPSRGHQGLCLKTASFTLIRSDVCTGGEGGAGGVDRNNDFKSPPVHLGVLLRVGRRSWPLKLSHSSKANADCVQQNETWWSLAEAYERAFKVGTIRSPSPQLQFMKEIRIS